MQLASSRVGNGSIYARNQVVSVLGLLQTPKGHLGARDIFLGVFQVFKLKNPSDKHVIYISYAHSSAHQSILLPYDAFGLIRVRVREALHLTGLATEQTMKIWADLVTLALAQSVALRASRLHSESDMIHETPFVKKEMMGTLKRLAPLASSPVQKMSAWVPHVQEKRGPPIGGMRKIKKKA